MKSRKMRLGIFYMSNGLLFRSERKWSVRNFQFSYTLVPPAVACCMAQRLVPYFAANFLRLNLPVALSALTFSNSIGLK